jgi:glycosyltransferase involved in cell wall biosynthesis
VIVCGRGSVPEVVRHGETGWIVGGISEAVGAVAAVGALDRAQIRASAAERFSRERMVDAYLQLYEGIR